jgi:hypothetical protein
VTTKTLLLMTVIRMAAISAVSGQDRPVTLCGFDGFGADPRLAEVATAHSTTGYRGCSSDENCLPVTLAPGDPMVVYRVAGDWTCGYTSQGDGAGPGWVRSTDIRLVEFDPHPSVGAWAGRWAGGEDRVAIVRSSAAGELALKGSAAWHGYGDVVHTGDFSATAAPHGNHLHVVESGSDSCTVDLTLIGAYIVASDNGKCGGMNVRFQGIWKSTGE